MGWGLASNGRFIFSVWEIMSGALCALEIAVETDLGGRYMGVSDKSLGEVDERLHLSW